MATATEGATEDEAGAAPHPRAPRLGYIPALDGLRAVAVIAVLLYHADVPWWKGGFLGVDVFFVISGYLITCLLLADWTNHHNLGLGRFWYRRARRLLPALFVMLAVVSVYAALFLPDVLAQLRGEVLAAVFYVENWFLIFRDLSYFQAAGRPPLLQHVWSLAVEEQFYLLWPIAFLALAPSRRWLFVGAMFLLGPTSRLITWRLFPEWQLMIGEIFPTVMDALATGVLLALLRTTLHSIPAYLGALGSRWCVLLPFAVLGLNALGSEATIFRWALGSTLANVGIALLIDRAIAFPHTPSGRFLNLPVIRYLGRISYSFYLWQQFFLDRSHHAWYTSFPVNLALAGLAAAASYHLVERPILRLRDRFRAVPA